MNGTSRRSTVKVAASGTRVDVTGLTAAVHIFSPEPADRLQVNGLAQADELTAGPGLALLIGLTLSGGTGNDTLTGGDGADTLDGGDRNDVSKGGAGGDLMVGGPGSDAMNGQAGADNYDLPDPRRYVRAGRHGHRRAGLSVDPEKGDSAPRGAAYRQTRRMGKYAALAAAVAIATGLSVAAPADAAYKARISKGTLTLTGNGAGEKMQLRLRPGNKNVLQVDVGLNGTSDFSLDRRRFKRIVVNAGGGNDTLSIAETFGAFTNTEKTTLNGGAGNDRITGGRYAETYSGGPGEDWLLGKDGGDLFVWASPDGDDRVDGQGGFDVVALSGSGSGDVFDISPSSAASASRAERTRWTQARPRSSRSTVSAATTSSPARPGSPRS